MIIGVLTTCHTQYTWDSSICIFYLIEQHSKFLLHTLHVLYICWIDSVHTTTSHFLKIHLNVIHPSTPGSPKWSLSFKFPHQNPVYAYPLPHTRYMPRPSHSSRFYHPNNIVWGVQVIKLLITYDKTNWEYFLYLIFYFLIYTGLFKMIVGVLTTCHTQYTWDSSICVFFI